MGPGSTQESIDLLVKYCLTFTGLPYKWGGDDPIKGFDCSGFAQEVLRAFGVPLSYDHTANALRLWQVQEGHPVGAQTGALCYYGTGRTTHVAIALNDFVCFEFGGGGSRTNTEEDAARHNAFGRIRPIRARNDFQGAWLPPYPFIEII